MSTSTTIPAPEAIPHHPLSGDPDWYKDAVFYEVRIGSYADGNGDGVGDFIGLRQKLDYIKELGVDCIWLLPMYPSPMRDDGYDISDFTSIHPDYGTLDDFQAFVDAAHERGIRVVADLVLNHSSDQHFWFQEALRDPTSKYRNYYVWSDDDTRYAMARIIFIDTELSNWAWSEAAGRFYWHRFFSHQPDLNYDDEGLRNEMLNVMRFWLDKGLDGFRCDAVPYLYEREGTNCENLDETHNFLAELRATIDREYGSGRLLLGEANQWPRDVIEYFGEREKPEFQMSFHFPLMPRLYIGLAKADRTPIVDIIYQTPPLYAGCQWAIFLRNHDELTLEMLDHDDRELLWEAYAPDPRMPLNLGIRRRLAPLLGNDMRKIKLMNGLLLSMPGTPVIYYGDEIGMGDDLTQPDRSGVRTPMQWSAEPNAGFTTGTPKIPVIDQGTYDYHRVNVEAQQADPESLLEWMKKMIAIRKPRRAFGHGRVSFLYPPGRSLLTYLSHARAATEITEERRVTKPLPSVEEAAEGEILVERETVVRKVTVHKEETILCVANLSDRPLIAAPNLYHFQGCQPTDLLHGLPYPPVGAEPYPIELEPYGFRWLLLTPLAAPEVSTTTEVEERRRRVSDRSPA